jgi:transposase
MERTSRETWAKRVERWQDSGLTAKEYAAEVGINAHSLSWWKWRLSSGARAQGGVPRKRRSAISPATPSPLTFVEMTSAVIHESLEVVLPSSIRIRVPSSFDAPTLGRLLDVLEHRG